jgi:membrane protein implicated in regulation of membrane protease activity
MNEKPKSFLSITLLLFTAVLSVWLGIAGPLFGDRSWIHIWHLMERWQTFVAALLALSAAWWAARPVQRQLAEQRRQSAAAASTMIAKSALALEDERAAVIKGKDDLESIANVLSDYDDQSVHDISQTWPKQAYSVSDTCSTLIAILHRTNERNPEITPLKNSREAAISTLNDFRSAIIDLAQVFHHDTSGPDYEHGEDDIPEEESRARRPRVDARRELWKAAAADLENELNAEISMIWRRVRQLERIAIGPD